MVAHSLYSDVMLPLVLMLVPVLSQSGGHDPSSTHKPLVAVNAGGPRTVTTEGLVYEADRSRTSSPLHQFNCVTAITPCASSNRCRYFIGGQLRRGRNETAPLTGWAASELYQTLRAATASEAGWLNYSFPLAPDDYAHPEARLVLTLRVAEFKASTQPGQRVFDIYVNNMPAVSGVDIAEVASWRGGSPKSHDDNESDVRLHDVHIELDVEHAGWFIRVHGLKPYAGFFGQLNVSLATAEGAPLMPQLCALLLTTGQIKGAPQTLPFEPGAEGQRSADQNKNPSEGIDWVKLTSSIIVVALVSAGVNVTHVSGGHNIQAPKTASRRQRQSKQARKHIKKQQHGASETKSR